MEEIKFFCNCSAINPASRNKYLKVYIANPSIYTKKGLFCLQELCAVCNNVKTLAFWRKMWYNGVYETFL